MRKKIMTLQYLLVEVVTKGIQSFVFTKSQNLQQVCKQVVNKLCLHVLLEVVDKFEKTANNLY